jgi:hypothetical protein
MRLYAFLLALVMMGGVAYTTTIHVPGDQPTIQSGINAAMNGDMALVAPSIYYERVIIEYKSMVLISDIDKGTFFNYVFKGGPTSHCL